MADKAVSDDPAVQAQLDRLNAMAPGRDILGFDRIRRLLAALGNPEQHMPPVLHIAGTNGKGSTSAYLRHIIAAQGLTAHAYTSPHLVRLNERIRLANVLIEDAMLAQTISDVLDASKGELITFFEAITCTAFLAFSRVPADALVLEVGVGGRLDATNVVPSAAVCGIATLGIDHADFLLAPEEGVPSVPLARIAFEKAGIAKHGVPLVTQAYPAEAEAAIAEVAAQAGAPLVRRGHEWSAELRGDRIAYADAQGTLDLPLPHLPGAHQADNAALAVAMLRHQTTLAISPEAYAQGIAATRWPARLQQLDDGPLTSLAGGRRVWLDGGHNPDAGTAIGSFFNALPAPPRLHLILGMLSTKDPAALLTPLEPLLESVSIVPPPGHEVHDHKAFIGHTSLPLRDFPGVTEGLAALPPGGEVLIAGSLYLAGEVLRLNREFPN